jgi:hypothetical protein
MGHLLKNTVFKSGSHTLGIPSASSSVGPDVAQRGQTRYNTTTSKLEFFNNNVWNAVAKEGTTLVTKDSFTGNSSNTEYGPMSFSYASGFEANVMVHVGAVYQIPTTNYTFYGNTTIHFTSAPSDGAEITIIHGLNSTTTA